MVGGGLFDLDANLLGLVVLCNGRPAVLSNASVQTTLVYGNSFEGRMATRYGMQLANLSESEQVYHKRKEGAIVRETWQGYRAGQAGLLPGDVIVSLEEKPVRSVDDLEVMVLPLAQEIFELRIERGGRILPLRLRARPASAQDGAEDAHAGLKLSSPPEGYPIDSVLPGSAAAAAGIQSGDRLLKIDHEDVASANAVRQALASSRERPLHLVLERSGRRWEVLLQ
jgi:S1-C subfamily serine protease